MIEVLQAPKFTVAVDFILMGRAPAPGVPAVRTQVPADKTTLSPPKLKRNWDVKQGWGLDGAFCVYTGEGLATFDATFEFWSEEKELLWDAFASVYLTSPAGRPEALSIYHPILMSPPFSIKNVQVTEIEGWGLVSPGRWQTRLSFLEYRPQKTFVPAKTEPVVPAVVKNAPARPATEQELRIQASTARLAAAANAGKR
jgi:hypothetical protein